MAMSNGVTGGVFANLADLQASRPREDTIVQLVNGAKYKVVTSDTGANLPFENGNFAEPIPPITPEHFGSGGANDDTALTNAFTFANTNNLALELNGSYTSTTSIPFFNSVQKSGTGSITRGSNTYYISPTNDQESIIYLDPTGLDTNDGLTSDQPLLTPAAAAEAIQEFGDFIRGQVRVVLAAGTYSGGFDFDSKRYLPSAADIIIQGPNVTINTQPTAIINGGGTATDGIVVRQANVDLRNIEFTGFTQSCVEARQQSQGVIQNVWTDGGSTGLNISRESIFTVSGGNYRNSSDQQLRNYLYSYVLLTNNPTFDGNNAATGIRNQAAYLTSGNSPTATIQNCQTGILSIYGASRTRLSNITFRNNTIDASINTNATVRILDQSNTFVDGSDVARSPRINTNSGAVDGIYSDAKSNITLDSDYTNHTHTGDTNLTTFYTSPTVYAGGFVDGQRLRITVKGSSDGSGTKDVILQLGGGSVYAPSGSISAGSTRFNLVVDVVAVSDSSQKYYGETLSGSTSRVALNGTRSINTSNDIQLELFYQLADPAASIDVDFIEVELLQ